jgi:hypothetical protein
MSANHIVNTSDYILSTESVITAGRRLQKALETRANPAKLEYAIKGLERAAQQQESSGADYHAFMFSELETAPETDKITRERVTEDVLASVLTDLHVANVLMAAGQAVGEIEGEREPKKLRESLLQLERTSSVVEQCLASPIETGPEPGRFGFSEEAADTDTVKSPDLASAITTYKDRSGETLVSFVNDAKDVVMNVVKKLSEIDFDKVFDLLSDIGGKIGDLSKVGRLFKQGVKKLQDAVNALLRLLGDDVVQKIKTQVNKVWSGLKDGKYVAGPLEWSFGVEETKKQIQDILKSDKLNQESLDEGSNALAKLKVAFKENMGLLSGVAAAVSLAGTLLFFIPAIGPYAALTAASINLLILGAVILIGMDYTDSGILLRRVRGVREITLGMLSKPEK